MATWQFGTGDWTPARAVRLADVLTRHGAGHLRQVINLRKGAAARSPVLAQRAEAAYEAAADELRHEDSWEQCVCEVSNILASGD